jgi:hypothetical protein
MRVVRITLAASALLFLSGWLWLRPPYSPTQTIPPVSYTAFEVQVGTEQAGVALAQAARGWKGVTASTFNPSSGLLVLSHTEEASVRDLQGRLQILSSAPVSKKVFPEPAGAKCPVPQATIAALPFWLLGLGLTTGLGFILLWVLDRKPKHQQAFS